MGENEGCGKGRKTKKKRLAREEKNNGLEALLTEKLYLCV